MNYTVTLSSIIIITRQSFIQSSNAIAFIFFSSHAELLSSIPIHSLRSQNITSDTIQGDIEENHGSDDTEGSSDSAENASENQSGDLTFADLAKYSFEFCSGAGGWSTDFEIEKDGSFKGSYHDSDMGDTGDDYENGTMYLCGFSGKFTDLTKINDYTYQMKMENLTYDETPGKEEIADGVKYIYTDVYGLEGTDTFKVYLPGAPVRDLSEDVYFWVRWAMTIARKEHRIR